ncbi:hypothetical protein K440DRAFT_132204 [Wilcoxina mikolae CBS 423.85]|nr:hypothetical protein K440DRAFT_132204 [Wilcoxina mikolae CBS 423.85]
MNSITQAVGHDPRYSSERKQRGVFLSGILQHTMFQVSDFIHSGVGVWNKKERVPPGHLRPRRAPKTQRTEMTRFLHSRPIHHHHPFASFASPEPIPCATSSTHLREAYGVTRPYCRQLEDLFPLPPRRNILCQTQSIDIGELKFKAFRLAGGVGREVLDRL